MKTKFVGMASILSLLALSACSDETSSPKLNDVNAPALGSSSSVVDPNNNLPLNSSDDVAVDPDLPDPNENIADQPFTEEEKKDDGTASVGSLPFSVSGSAQFGPFVAPSSVVISSVNLTNMEDTPIATGTVSNTAGDYAASGTLNSAVASFSVSGSYYDFANDQPATSSGLKAISDLRERKTVNVNVLTHLEYFRVQYLIAGQGLSFTAAKDRAQKELTVAFGFKSDSTLFEDMNLYSMASENERLIAVTAAILYGRSGAESETLLNALALDFTQDGRLDDDANKALVGDAAFELVGDEVLANLSSFNGNADVMTITSSKKSVWSSMFNLGSCSDLNINEVKSNLNPKSSIQDKYFACREGGWSIASAAHISNYQVAQIFGNCTSELQGTIKENSGKTYICKNNLWSEATADEIAAAAVVASNGPCTVANEKAVVVSGQSAFICLSNIWTRTVNSPVDYSKGRAMNKKLGRGINFGNSWESPGNGDSDWNNPIQDGDFAAVKAAGFNSVRIPVRWYTNVSTKLAGVKADVDLALAQGLTVIVNFHHYEPMWEAAKQYPNGSYVNEVKNYESIWETVSQAFASYPDDKVVLEILNEPRDMSNDAVNDLMTRGYKIIRKNNPGKTIMFEGNAYSKFAQIPNLNLPTDGNIIVSGHYYDPYSFSHQGHDYDCNANAKDGISSMPSHFKGYVDSIAVHFPDVNGGSVPVNLGEFGVANKGGCQSISDSKREAWTDAVIAQAEKYDMSWQYWCYKNCGGFEASNGSSWYGNMLQVFQKYMK